MTTVAIARSLGVASLLVVASSSLADGAGPQFAATQLFQVKGSANPSRRGLTYKVKDAVNGLHILGQPTPYGATFGVNLDGVTRCFPLPGPNWRGGPLPYTYRDPLGLAGPISRAEIVERVGGELRLKVVWSGKHAAIDLQPSNPSVQADVLFRILGPNGGDTCGSTVGGTIVKNTLAAFKVTNAPAPASCNVTCP